MMQTLLPPLKRMKSFSGIELVPDNPSQRCQNPPMMPPLPPVDQLCLDSGMAKADAEAACASEKARGHGMFEGCVEDCCALGVLDDCGVGAEDFDNLDDSETDD